jgi:hypothetical protein
LTFGCHKFTDHVNNGTVCRRILRCTSY